MGVSQFKQPVPPALNGPQPPPNQSPRWEIGIDRNRVAAFIGVALIAGFGFGYVAARYLAWSRATTEKAKAAARAGPTDSIEAGQNGAPAGAPSEFHKVTRIVRADTIEAEGLGGVRMIGVNPPGGKSEDPKTGLAQNAMKFTTETLLGKEVRIEFEPSIAAGGNKDEAGNTFAYVYTRDGALFNEELIRQGDAFAKVDQPSKFLEQFRAAEREAMEKMRGVWSPADKSDRSGKGTPPGSFGDRAGRPEGQPRLPDMSPSIPGTTLDARMPGGGSDPMIFVSGSDRMYHKEGCQYLGKKARPMPLSEAKAAGYVACGRCFASTVMKAP